MSRFAFFRRRKMRRDGGFWVHYPNSADLPFFPLFPWRWIEPGEKYTPSDFVKNGIHTHTLDEGP